MGSSPSRSMFTHFRKSLLEAGLSTASDDSLICPLCWQEVHVDQLSVEHVIPESVGGVATVLTCERCNNSHGSKLDSQLANYQKMADALSGHRTFPGEVWVNGNRLAVQVEWGQGFKNFAVSEQATNPVHQERIRADFAAGEVKHLKLEFSFGYRPNDFRVAVLRVAYLVLHKWLGYRYSASHTVQILRRRIADPSLAVPKLETMQIALRNPNLPTNVSHFVFPGEVTLAPDKNKQSPFYLVILRLRQKTDSWIGMYMPQAHASPDSFFDLMEQIAREHDGRTLTLPSDGLLFDAKEL